MTLAEIMRLALRQLDEDPADIAEYDELFRMWANQGYQIVLQNYFKPRETLEFSTDESGAVDISEGNIIHIVSLRDTHSMEVPYAISEDGKTLQTNRHSVTLTAVCEVVYPPLKADTDVPEFPEHVHSMLVDYICYKYLLRGNAAKQNRAQAFQAEFYRQAQQLKSAGQGSVTHMKNLYLVSDARFTRW